MQHSGHIARGPLRRVVLVAHNLRSTHNVGSLLRTAEGLGIEKVYLTGYTPYPRSEHDDRLPHLAIKIDNQIHKTALGAEQMVVWEHHSGLGPVLAQLRAQGFQIAALEQDPKAVSSAEFQAPHKIALVVGREVEGIEPEVLEQCDIIVEIPMHGHKESFNVAAAAAMVLYQLRLLTLSSA